MKRHHGRWSWVTAWRLTLAGIMVWGSGAACAAVTNIVLMIGDGMGFEHLRAASLYVHGREGALFMESLPHRGEVVTTPAWRLPPGADPAATPPKVTDSAAAATAMATGRKVFNGVLSLALPGDGTPLETIVERFAREGRRVGIVTTAHLTDATPAAFIAHVTNRGEAVAIAHQLLAATNVHVMLGAPDRNPRVPLRPDPARAAGWLVVTNRQSLLAAVSNPPPRLLGLFGDGGPMCYEYDHAHTTRREYERLPHLSEMARAAARLVEQGTNGFFLMIEGANIDKAAHGNHLERMIYETIEFDRAVREIVEWAVARGDTLVVVTADHETGGLKVVAGQGAGRMPVVTWAGRSHTGATVPIWATGPGAERVGGRWDNTDIWRLMVGVFERPTEYVPEVGEEPVLGGGMPD
ncbi:MAG: alkaline phosphatase [Kiritimatiellae bacterium]|nr:alkaline phosphatase [Kiritimatiellia bacterium]